MLNKVILMGRLTRDPEFRQTTSGVPVCRFSIAINRQFANKQTGERETDFVDCVAWRNTAEFVSRYFSKGNMILVEGQLRNDNYTDNNGVKHYRMNVFVDNVSFCESKGNGGQGGGDYYGVNKDQIGCWALDVISIEETAPSDYERKDFEFYEK
jgi:single-strand DNA-binding protein